MEPKDISQVFQYTNKGFSIDGVLLRDIMSELDSPAYIYADSIVRRQFSKLRDNLPPRVEICYAVKANPSLAMMQILKNCGTGFEVASFGELIATERVGADPSKIVFAGPGKNYWDLSTAIEKEVASINVESYGVNSELFRVSNLACKIHKRANVSLRINPDYKIKGAAVTMTGEPTQFGIEESALEKAVEGVRWLRAINLKGIHVFAATNMTDHESFMGNLENSFKLAERMNRICPVTMIDIGSGISIRYKDGDAEFPVEGLGKKINEMMDKYPFIKNNNARIILEPGRYLVGESGVYVARVEDVKNSRGKKYVVLDGGINHMLRPALIDSSEHQAFNLSRNSGARTNVDVVGPLCTSLDVLAKDASLDRDTQSGDYIGVFCAGAYGFTESMPNFLSHDSAAEVLVHNGKFDIIRPGIKVEEIFENQVIPGELC
ncbi:MAG: hypothetical protein AABX17_00330 [Nanoarchaeota archaeon]